MSKPRFLTKSRYKLGLECPTKLFYTGKEEYPDQKLDDPFLEALAEGGHQVGELAKCYFPTGIDITTLDYDEAERQTLEFLKKDQVIIFEPAIRFKNLFIRIDILVKDGNHFDLIEVKAKSFDSTEEHPFQNKNGSIKSSWHPYLCDVAFQQFVLKSVFPKSNINAFLMLADKNAKCPTDGLNQKFKITKDTSNRKGISVSSSLSKEDVKKKILIQVNVDNLVEDIQKSPQSEFINSKSYQEEIELLANSYENDQRISNAIGVHCSSCEFDCSDEGSLKSGFKECWKGELGWDEKDFNDPTVLEIWNYRGKAKLIDENKIKLKDLEEDDIAPKENKKSGLSSSQRQWMQIEKAVKKDKETYFDAEGMLDEMSKWQFPLHFIDFETSAVAIPFNKGMKPYEGIAFQFSHHTVYENGTIEHSGQYINTKKGFFPNFEFVRKLKEQLENDKGTIFRYAPHENTYLNLIYRQILESENLIEDKEEICTFIKSITKSVGSSVEEWIGDRNMIDMWELVKKYYYDPSTNGSNSIKAILPAILNSSDFLKEKYSKPIYGSENGIKSLNFKDWVWIREENGIITDPYKLLPKLFQDVSDRNMELLSDENELANGGAALTAYARMQFTEMSDYECTELKNGLLKYCELDTFAMVLIYEGWKAMIRQILGEEAA